MHNTFFFSGIEKTATAKVLGYEQAAGMISRLEYSENLMSACDLYNVFPLTMDCGSFTSPLTDEDIQEYARLIIKYYHRILWFAMPDFIGDQVRSHRNYLYLLSLLPEEMHGKVLYIYQYGAPLEYLHAALYEHLRIGIGGLVPLLTGDRDRAYHVIMNLAHIIAAKNVEPHYFGLSIKSILTDLCHVHQSFSADSTTWLAAGRYGLLINDQGKQIPISSIGTQYNFSTSICLAQNVNTMRRWIEDVKISPKRKQKKLTVQMPLDLFQIV